MQVGVEALLNKFTYIKNGIYTTILRKIYLTNNPVSIVDLRGIVSKMFSESLYVPKPIVLPLQF
jgi:hypothetical protein